VLCGIELGFVGELEDLHGALSLLLLDASWLRRQMACGENAASAARKRKDDRFRSLSEFDLFVHFS